MLTAHPRDREWVGGPCLALWQPLEVAVDHGGAQFFGGCLLVLSMSWPLPGSSLAAARSRGRSCLATPGVAQFFGCRSLVLSMSWLLPGSSLAAVRSGGRSCLAPLVGWNSLAAARWLFGGRV